MIGIDLITAERQRQISEENCTPEHDAEHQDDDLALAAVCYALPAHMREELFIRGDYDLPLPYHWPWAPQDWKPTPQDRIRELVKAGALIAAEIDRLQS